VHATDFTLAEVIKNSMADMLVKLYALPDMSSVLTKVAGFGIEIRRARSWESAPLSEWINTHFSANWVRECQAALGNRPETCFIAIEKQPIATPANDPYDNMPAERILGFSCYDATRKGMFGPEAVRNDYQGKSIGKALLLSCLWDMLAMGYAYAVIGWAGPTEFYSKTVGATIIAGSEPGIYTGPLQIE
jgi:hypothetical protein